MFGIKKDLERNRIEITISGDEIMMMLPDAIEELIGERQEIETDGYLKGVIKAFEKGVYVAYVPIDEIKIEGF